MMAAGSRLVYIYISQVNSDMADALFVVLSKLADSLGEQTLERISTKLIEVAPVLTDFEHSMKQIEAELLILQAFIAQVGTKVGDKAFDAWLDQVRDVAHEVEDIIDEYAYLEVQAVDTGSFFKRKFLQIKKFAAWQKFHSQISHVEARIQRLGEIRNRYGILSGEIDRSKKLRSPNRLFMSDSSYLTDNSEIVGHVDEIGRLTQWLLEYKQERTLIAVFGMGGSGKTTIASSAYKSQKITRTFNCHAWVTVSQTYQVEELLREIINQLIDQRASMSSGFMTMSGLRLVEVIQSYLQDKKYFIVLDDVWDKDAWLFLNYAFVRNNCGSKVLITTRRKDVSSLAVDQYTIELKTLQYAESWELFCKKAFRASKDNQCPENLRFCAEKIVARCQGLPLAIVTIGSVLSYHEFEEQGWESFYSQLSWQLANNPELNWISNVLNMSLNDLPSYLRNCFLYCSLYPEDYKIKRKVISKLWIAEGLVEDREDGTTMEEVANYYLVELTQRCLLRVTESNACGRPRAFVMHDLVRELTSNIAKKEKFEVPGVVTELYNLRYIDFSYTKVKTIPASFRKLVNLQVLDLRFTYVEELPLEITTLTNLRHLHVFAVHDFQQRSLNCLGATKIPVNICHLKNLQAIQIVLANKDLVSQLGNLKLMRSLAIAEVRQSYIAELWKSLTKMPNLNRLAISTCNMEEILDFKMLKPLSNLVFFKLAGKLESGVLPLMLYYFEKLTWLQLDWSGLKKDPMSSLSHMSNLVHLFMCGSYCGEQLTFCSGWFPKLNYLQLSKMENLNWIEIEDGTMMCLNNLYLVDLGNLKAVPYGIKYIRTLHQMHLTDMSKEFLGSLQGSASPVVQHICNIHIFESSDSEAVNKFFFEPYLATKFGPGATKHAPTYLGSSGI
ncbi:Disease resistance protein RPM1 [Zea mays]|uniref:Disease resistance protein RPM1 n=2 Tax=Zea mays TaxID=4577 RepID=A0A8J8XHD6_MAIZE|nr:Disease resistance gene analog PIC11-1 [Zea mays]PWZ19826.1 Disease resistance protein RPM1 [Zea mays]